MAWTLARTRGSFSEGVGSELRVAAIYVALPFAAMCMCVVEVLSLLNVRAMARAMPVRFLPHSQIPAQSTSFRLAHGHGSRMPEI